MKTRILVLTCALGIAACGGSDVRPANDPASVNTTGAPSETTAVTPASSSVMATSTGDATQPGATPTKGVGRQLDQPGKAVAPAAASTPADPGTTAAQPATGAPVVSPNPGVADDTKSATNTKINDRDRHGALTPMDQGGSEAERNITAAIRKGVMGDKALSFTAKNVKIITTGTKVTLRGPVKSDQERSAIESRAKQTAGVTEVDNQIEVKK